MATVKSSGDAKADLAALNKEFLQYIESEFKSGAASCDWSPMVKDYIAQRDSLVASAKAGGGGKAGSGAGGGGGAAEAPAPAAPPIFGGGGPGGGGFGGGAAAAPSLFGGGAGGFGGGSTPAPAPSALPAAPPAPTMAAASSSGGGGGADADEKFKKILKLSVYRQEKRNEEGELVQEKGWKTIGKGQLRLLHTEGVHFVEFRPEVSEGTQAEPEDEVVGAKTRFGRPVLTAALKADTKFEVLGKKAVQVNLLSADASGKAVFARYNMPLGSEAEATEFATLAMSLRPSA